MSGINNNTNESISISNTGTIDISGDVNLNGNVGIGTTNPTSKLDVNGKISTQDSLEIGPINDMYKGLTVSKSNVKMVIGNSGGDGNYGSMQVFACNWKTKLQQVVLRHIIWLYSQMEEMSVLEPRPN